MHHDYESNHIFLLWEIQNQYIYLLAVRLLFKLEEIIQS